MDAITLLKKQHADVKALFKQFKEHHDSKRRKTIFDAIADTFAAHCEIEEKLFYPAVFIGQMQPLVQEAVEEHLSAKRVIADLLGMEPTDRQFVAKMAVLDELIKHHVGEEHDDLFPAVREKLTTKALRDLGERMASRFEELMKGRPRDWLQEQTTAAAELPLPDVYPATQVHA